MRDWVAWHQQYDNPESSLRVRLGLVRAHLSAALDAAPPGPVSLVSLCAGQGHDVLGVLPGHRRRPDVTSWRDLLEHARNHYERTGDELVAS